MHIEMEILLKTTTKELKINNDVWTSHHIRQINVLIKLKLRKK